MDRRKNAWTEISADEEIDEKIDKQKNGRTKNWSYEEIPKRKNEWTKKCTEEKINYEKMCDEKPRDEKMRDEKLRDDKLRTKKCPTKICLTKIGPDTLSGLTGPWLKSRPYNTVKVVEKS